jgi:cephalosporin hydroxylase
LRTLADIYKDFTGPVGGDCGDKGTVHGYIPIYEELFRSIREKQINLLEIGVAAGHSMAMWRHYFPNAGIWGIDIDPARVNPNLMDGWTLISGDATNPECIAAAPPHLDIVIDDGSHRVTDQLRTFAMLAPRLRSGSIYCIEDVQNASPFASDARAWKRTVYDLRPQSHRPDDILIVLEKP